MTASPGDPHVGVVVEGRGDAGAVPLLLRKYLTERGDFRDVLGKPIPVNGRDNALVPGGIEGYVAAAGFRPGCVGVLALLDGEGDCVAIRGAELLARAGSVLGKPVTVALAVDQYEDWLYASIETLGLGPIEFDPGRSGISVITAAIKPRKYVKPVWQPRLSARVDIKLAVSRSPSLLRALQRFDELLTGLGPFT